MAVLAEWRVIFSYDSSSTITGQERLLTDSYVRFEPDGVLYMLVLMLIVGASTRTMTKLLIS